MRQIVLLTALGLFLAAPAGAETLLPQEDALPLQFDFRFESRNADQLRATQTLLLPDFKSQRISSQYEQLDARLMFPWQGKGMRLGVGLNLRHIQGIASWADNGIVRNASLNDTIPAITASALFDLPFEGLSAEVEGSHSGITDQLVDYKAGLRYEWGNGLGLEGGWQHQQLSLDLANDASTTFESQGPFLDLRWRF